ncbi:hypothetical protein CRG98_032073 [Punica granatum]|uniref:Uncharacterized protein n=1 Tax=Punica granatum TaxID=22663 RepID=A0A2I0IUN7_PUNGR|nr:hypothetical protein CRG98_032073 [Punica granatum]
MAPREQKHRRGCIVSGRVSAKASGGVKRREQRHRMEGVSGEVLVAMVRREKVRTREKEKEPNLYVLL